MRTPYLVSVSTCASLGLRPCFLVRWDGLGAGRGTPNALNVSNGSLGFSIQFVNLYYLEAPVGADPTPRNFADSCVPVSPRSHCYPSHSLLNILPQLLHRFTLPQSLVISIPHFPQYVQWNDLAFLQL